MSKEGCSRGHGPRAPELIDIVIGPTASGKTAYAIQRAQEVDGIIINADSMQIYDALPILTAQPDAQERAQAEHRLYSALDPSDYCGAGRWRDLVIQEIESVLGQGKRPILVGGSGFYIHALTDGFSPIPDIPITLRLTLEQEALEDLVEELRQVDPVLAEQLHDHDRQRITRALEVYRHTGKPLSEWQNLPLIQPPEHYRFHTVALLPDRAALYEKINARVPVMLERGALDEVRDLSQKMDQGEVADHCPVVKAHGFRAFRKVIKGEMDRDEAIDATAQETRHYAKRQMTWARNRLNPDEVIS